MPKAPGIGLPTSVEQSMIKYVPNTAPRFAGDNLRSPTKPMWNILICHHRCMRSTYNWPWISLRGAEGSATTRLPHAHRKQLSVYGGSASSGDGLPGYSTVLWILSQDKLSETYPHRGDFPQSISYPLHVPGRANHPLFFCPSISGECSNGTAGGRLSHFGLEDQKGWADRDILKTHSNNAGKSHGRGNREKTGRRETCLGLRETWRLFRERERSLARDHHRTTGAHTGDTGSEKWPQDCREQGQF